LLGKHGVHVFLELLAVLGLEHLDTGEGCQALLLTVNEQVPRLLECQSMVTLGVVNLIEQVLIDELVSRE